MGLRIRTNISSINAQRNLENTTRSVGDDMTKLSSGYRINKAADDAAGLAISESMRAQVRSMQQAQRNANDGVSVVQIAEGSMNEITNILIRLRELATQAASDTIGNVERSFANREYGQLVNEIDRISKTTEFNGLPLLQGQDAVGDEDMFTLHVGAGDGSTENTDTIRIRVEDIFINAADTLGLSSEAEIGPMEPGDSFSRSTAAEKLTVIDNALQSVSSSRAYLGAQQSRLNSAIGNLGTQIENMSAARSRIRDVDFAEVSASFTQGRILQQAGTAVLSQANALPELAIQLIR
jgi:flagellin